MAFLTLKQAADRLTLHWKTVYRLVHEGKIPARKLTDGPKAPIRIDEDDLDLYLARCRPVVEPSQAEQIDERAALGLPRHHEFS